MTKDVLEKWGEWAAGTRKTVPGPLAAELANEVRRLRDEVMSLRNNQVTIDTTRPVKPHRTWGER